MERHGFTGGRINQAFFLQVHLKTAPGGDIGVAAAVAFTVFFPQHLASIWHNAFVHNSNVRLSIR